MQNRILVFTLVVLISGCASAVKRHEVAEVQINQQINCTTAKEDIASLKMEKSSTAEKLANGIASILPTSIIFNLLTGEFTSRKAIATGEFDQMLYMKIDDIEQKCDMRALAKIPEKSEGY